MKALVHWDLDSPKASLEADATISVESVQAAPRFDAIFTNVTWRGQRFNRVRAKGVRWAETWAER